MTIDTTALRELLCARLCEEVGVSERPDGELMLRTHFTFPDGDGYPFHLAEAPAGGLRLSDLGHTATTSSRTSSWIPSRTGRRSWTDLALPDQRRLGDHFEVGPARRSGRLTTRASPDKASCSPTATGRFQRRRTWPDFLMSAAMISSRSTSDQGF